MINIIVVMNTIGSSSMHLIAAKSAPLSQVPESDNPIWILAAILVGLLVALFLMAYSGDTDDDH